MGDLVKLRGTDVPIDSDDARAFIKDCARFCEGLLAEELIKARYQLDDLSRTRLAENEPLVEAVQREKEFRIARGICAREKAQLLYVQAPDVLGDILQGGDSISPRHKIESARELRAIATSGSEATPATDTQFIIRFDLTAAPGGEVIELTKSLGPVGPKPDNESELPLLDSQAIGSKPDGDTNND
jgi:hypothetical protein